MRSAIWSRQSAWELWKAGRPMTLCMGISLVCSPSSQTSHLLGTGLRLLKPL